MFVNLDFQSDTENSLMDAISFLKECFSNKTALTSVDPSTFPTEFIKHGNNKYLDHYKVKIDGKEKTIKRLSPDKYEYYVYRIIEQKLSSGDVFIKDSIKYKNSE